MMREERDDNLELESGEPGLEKSLRALPLVDLPPGFVNRVMVQVAAQPQMAPVRFRLQFLDVALAIGLGSFVTLLLVMAFWYREQMDIGWLPTLMAYVGQGGQSSTAVLLWLALAGILAAEVAVGAFVCVQLWQDRAYTVA